MKYGTLVFTAAILVTAGLHGQANYESTEPPKGAQLVLQAKGKGVQIYTCTEGQDGRKWVLKGPDAKLLDSRGKVIGTHFAGPTWKLNDGGMVQGQLPPEANAPSPSTVPWLLLRAKEGTPSGSLAGVSYIRRSETKGGAPSPPGCKKVGKILRVKYTATYTFYSAK